MPVQSKLTLTLDQIAEVISGNETIAPATRAEMTSAITTFARVCGRPASQIIADPGVIREWTAKAQWQLAGVSKAHWANVRSRLTRALQSAGVNVHRRRRNFRPNPDWQRVLADCAETDRIGLTRFAGWCSTMAVGPSDVGPGTFDAYLAYLTEQSVQVNPRERWHVARRAWNRSVAKPGSPYKQVPLAGAAVWRGLQWADFPATLQREVEAYRKAKLRQDLFTPGHRRLAPVTIDNYLVRLRLAATHLVQDAGVPIGDLHSLAELVAPHRIKQAIQLRLGERSLDEARPDLQVIAIAALNVGKYVGLPPAQMAELMQVFKTVKNQVNGMTRKNKERLGQFSPPEVLERLVSLPLRIAGELRNVAKPSPLQALRMQSAVALEILLHAPVRVKNLAGLDLVQHVNRPPGGKPGQWRIHVPAHEVKNGVDIDVELGPESSSLLALYVDVFRPALASASCSRLFVSLDGTAKSQTRLGKQFKTFVRREIGVTMNIHLARHLSAFVYLKAHPGDYESVRRLLGHKQLSTTATIYAGGAEAQSAWARLDRIIGDSRRSSERSDALPASRKTKGRAA